MSSEESNLPRCILAALNNAEWVNIMSTVDHHDLDPASGLWVCTGKTPPYTPNVVTLVPDRTEDQISRISDLRSTLAGSWAVKDSFAQLDLHPLGFNVLFEAQWLWFDPASTISTNSSVEWSIVRTDNELKEWEVAWRTPQDANMPNMFSSRLLNLQKVSVVAGRAIASKTPVAGFVLCQSQEVIGMSNFFSQPGSEEEIRAHATCFIREMFPDQPIVDYEHGDALVMAQQVGYEAIGPLRVWTC